MFLLKEHQAQMGKNHYKIQKRNNKIKTQILSRIKADKTCILCLKAKQTQILFLKRKSAQMNLDLMANYRARKRELTKKWSPLLSLLVLLFLSP